MESYKYNSAQQSKAPQNRKAITDQNKTIHILQLQILFKRKEAIAALNSLIKQLFELSSTDIYKNKNKKSCT